MLFKCSIYDEGLALDLCFCCALHSTFYPFLPCYPQTQDIHLGFIPFLFTLMTLNKPPTVNLHNYIILV